MGYSKEIFVNAVNQVFICVVCMEIVKYPKECLKCQNLICAECTLQIIKKGEGSLCPKCEEPLLVKQANKNVKHLLEAYIVNCYSCSWQGTLREFEKHEENEHTKNSPQLSSESTPKFERNKSKWHLTTVTSSPEFESTDKFEEYRLKLKEKSLTFAEEKPLTQRSSNLFQICFNQRNSNENLSCLVEESWRQHLQLFNYALNFTKGSMHSSIISKETRGIWPSSENKNQFQVCVFPPKLSIGPVYTWSFRIIRGLEWIIGICNKNAMENSNFLLQKHLFHNFGYGWNTKYAKCLNDFDNINYGVPIQEGEIVNVQVDTKKGRISFGVNGTFYGIAFEDQVFNMIDRWPAVAGKEGEIEVIQ